MDTIILILEIIALIGFSAICSGLNIAIMALQPADLRRKAKLGSRQAQRILPLRNNIHLTLAAIILTNVAIISTTSLVLDSHLATGVLAGIVSTLLIVIFGEILPQALFTKRALAFCAFFAPLLRVMVIVTYPITKPLQLLLDKIIGHEKRSLHTRNELGMIISEHLDATGSELDEDEVEIMRATLQLSEKRVRDIMAPIEDVFWIQPNAKITATTINKIKKLGHSRIPVFDRELTQCYGVLLVKDLVGVDFSQAHTLDDFTLHRAKIVGSMTALDTMFRKFIGSHSHLIPVERDDRIVGIVTIEDLIEEIIGHEIEDETDRAKLKV